MKKFSFSILTVLLLFVGFSSAAAEGDGVLRFIYCSDLHYGLEREFRGHRAKSDEVARAMLATFDMLSGEVLPADSGVGAGRPFGHPDFVVCTGDIANRMEDGVQPAAVSWEQFSRDWYKAVGVPLWLVPGNHDISNAIGFPEPLVPECDATSAAEIYNLMMRPAVERTAQTFNYATDKTHYSFVKDGLRFVFMGLWPDHTMRRWFDAEVAGDSITPVILFTHDPPEADTKHFTNPHGWHTINPKDKFQNVVADTCLTGSVKDTPTDNWRVLERFVGNHPMIKAYFHGDKNYNEFYTWHGVDGTISLPVFRVDSPMKGEYSAGDERLLSFMVVTMDTASRRLTARECLWNTQDTTSVKWGDACTINY